MEKNKSNLDILVTAVIEMRNLQKEYFKTRNPKVLSDCIQIEKK